jgi:hypothetical protein
VTTCITNRCSQGHTPCPTPGVCNGNTQPALPIQYASAEEKRDTSEWFVKWVLAVLCLFALVATLSAAAGYLSVRP